MDEGSVPPLPRLPQDIIYQAILPRLPAKALMRLQCVSKGWHRLISGDPNFSLIQYRLGGASPSALLLPFEKPHPPSLCRDPASAGFPPLATQFPSRLPRIVASCAGILLILCNHQSSTAAQLYVGNPVLKVWAAVPLQDGWDVDRECEIGLAVYEADGAVRYALVDPYLKDDAGNVDGEHVEAGFRVFSSVTGSWAVAKESVRLRDWVPFVCSRACVAGRLFWWGGSEVVWFDPRNACGGTLPMPLGIRQWRKTRMGEWDGKLSFMEASPWDAVVWSWNRSSWRRTCTVELPLICNVRPHASMVNVVKTPSVVGFAAGFVMLYVNEELHSCDVVTGEARAHGHDQRLFLGPAFPYANSLLRLPAVPVVEGLACS